MFVKYLHLVLCGYIFEASQSRHRLCAETERPQIFCNTIFVIYWNMQTRNISILTPVIYIADGVWVQRGNSALRQFRCTILTLDNYFWIHPTITSSTCGPCTLGCSPTDIWFIVEHQNTLCNTSRFSCMNSFHNVDSRFWLVQFIAFCMVTLIPQWACASRGHVVLNHSPRWRLAQDATSLCRKKKAFICLLICAFLRGRLPRRIRPPCRHPWLSSSSA